MAYGQKSYNEKIGGGNGGKPAVYSIRQVGCFLTMFCNLLERQGRGVDPLTLNRIFIDRGIFIDIDDGVRDDLGWQSITAYDGQIVVKSVGTGRPPESPLVGLKLKLRGAVGGYHFVLFDHFVGDEIYILDSWDGQVKSIHAYGELVQWCQFGDNTPQAVTPYVAQVIPQSTGETLHLPAVPSWRVYSTATPWTPGKMIGKEIATLAPAKFGGLTYDVLGRPYANVVTIKTRDYGLVNIYVGAETNATITANVPAATPTAVPAVEPAAVSVPEATTPVADVPVEADKPTNIPFAVSYKNVADYEAKQDYPVIDLKTGERYADLLAGQVVHAVERFDAADSEGHMITWVRTQKAVDTDKYAGVPLGMLKVKQVIDIAPDPEEDDDKLFASLNLKDEVKEAVQRLTTRQHLIAFVLKLQAVLIKIKLMRK